MGRGRLRILVGVDFSRESLRALQAARSLTDKSGGVLTVAHIRPQSNVRAAVVEERGDLLRGSPGRLSAAMDAHYSRRFERLRRYVGDSRTLLIAGMPARALCREAHRGYDLLVLGSRGRGRVASFLLGSTVAEVLRRSPTPVLVTRQRS